MNCRYRKLLKCLLPPALVIAAVSLSSLAAGDDLDSVLMLTQVINNEGRTSQKKVNRLADDTHALRAEYKIVLKEVEALRIYNEQLRRQIAAQERKIDELTKSIQQVTVIQRSVTPLMLEMVHGLTQFVELDVPFQPKERHDRIERLKEIIGRPDVVVSEKFSAVLNAYQIENEYGRTMEAYSGILPGGNKVVDFLRVGRIVLAYQTTDGSESGAWNQKTRQFEALENSYNSHIKQGIRMARKQVAIDMIILPVAGPEEK